MQNTTTVKGYKVTNQEMQCRGFQFELNKEFEHIGVIRHCESGFHFCCLPADCFEYYEFYEPTHRMFEVEGYGTVITEGNKTVCSHIKFIRELSRQEIITIVNTGKDNTGLKNTGYRNSGNSNSGDSNSGNWNSGNWNSGDSNSGNWNSGNRNSGDSNSGYRNSGAFCRNPDPVLYLFDKPTTITVKEWEKSKAVQLMAAIDTTIWVPEDIMTDKEKEDNPKWETTEGYLKTIPIKEAWLNAWHNFSDENKKVFTTLPNFDAEIFEEITGIKVQ